MGRKPRTLTNEETRQALNKLTRRAVKVLQDALDKGDTDVAKFIVNHIIGAPKQKAELTGADGRAIEILVRRVNGDGN